MNSSRFSTDFANQTRTNQLENKFRLFKIYFFYSWEFLGKYFDNVDIVEHAVQGVLTGYIKKRLRVLNQSRNAVRVDTINDILVNKVCLTNKNVKLDKQTEIRKLNCL